MAARKKKQAAKKPGKPKKTRAELAVISRDNGSKQRGIVLKWTPAKIREVGWDLLDWIEQETEELVSTRIVERTVTTYGVVSAETRARETLGKVTEKTQEKKERLRFLISRFGHERNIRKEYFSRWAEARVSEKPGAAYANPEFREVFLLAKDKQEERAMYGGMTGQLDGTMVGEFLKHAYGWVEKAQVELSGDPKKPPVYVMFKDARKLEPEAAEDDSE